MSSSAEPTPSIPAPPDHSPSGHSWNPLAPAQPVDRATFLWRRFLDEVARRQLADWLPAEPAAVLDLSRHAAGLLREMVECGHRVVHGADVEPRPRVEPPDPSEDGALLTVEADARSVHWVADESVDLVVMEGGALSRALAAELTLEDLSRVLAPGGRMLLCVDSLVGGLSRLADLGRWAELADVPSADVVLVPGEGEAISRCFWPEELHGMLTDAGFDVEWVRPRTVLSEEAVTRALLHDPSRLPSLVTTELALERRRQGESIGAQLVASARRRSV